MQVSKCCTRLAKNTRRKKSQKNSPSAHHRTNLSGYIFATKAHIDNRKKNLLNCDISSIAPHNMVNFGPPAAELCTMFGRLLGWYTIDFRGLLLRDGILTRAKIHYVQVLHSPIFAALLHGTQQRASAKLCSVIQGMELRNFRRRRHLYSAGRPSRWVSAHILVH